ncbi:thioredoxin family protein [Crocosphaera sp.]|uniref:thioredoxin family protein n=1 Tax=Crocosphaera sp. TaxID=2729996 RepID=UPI002624829A|nr:thioredoxin family protein [Crocosphaera sp.]MDJ0583002.1 thioredoxin [Crocosphaera sp.]
MSSVLEITDSQFDTEVSKSETPVLVYFWASWCGPCRLVSPSIKKIADSYGDRLKVLKLEVDPNPNARTKCKVEGVPALRLYQDKELLAGQEEEITKQQLEEMLIAQHEGAITRQQLEEMLNQHLD